jgi:hypothetical protein
MRNLIGVADGVKLSEPARRRRRISAFRVSESAPFGFALGRLGTFRQIFRRRFDVNHYVGKFGKLNP